MVAVQDPSLAELTHISAHRRDDPCVCLPSREESQLHFPSSSPFFLSALLHLCPSRVHLPEPEFLCFLSISGPHGPASVCFNLSPLAAPAASRPVFRSPLLISALLAYLSATKCGSQLRWFCPGVQGQRWVEEWAFITLGIVQSFREGQLAWADGKWLPV